MPLSAGDKLGALPEAIGLLTIYVYGTNPVPGRNLFAKRVDQNDRQLGIGHQSYAPLNIAALLSPIPGDSTKDSTKTGPIQRRLARLVHRIIGEKETDAYSLHSFTVAGGRNAIPVDGVFRASWRAHNRAP
jgi:hypothetical protein